MGLVLILFIFLFACFAVGAAIMAFAGRRRAEQTSLMLMLSVAVDRRLNLADELRWYADTTANTREEFLYRIASRNFLGAVTVWFHTSRGSRLRQLANLLEEGYAIDEAFERARGLIPRSALLSLQVGAANGLVSQALRDSARRLMQRDEGARSFVDSFEWWAFYLAALLFAATAIVTFVMVMIVPKFKKIFDDFGTELPAVTRLVIDAGDSLGFVFILLWPGMLILVGTLVWFGVALSRGWDEFSFPLGRFSLRLQTPTLLRVFALAAQAGRPMEGVLEIVSRRHSQHAVAQKLNSALEAARRGESPWSALMRFGFLTVPEEAALRAAGSAGNLPWVLRELADSLEKRWNHRLALFREWIRPVIVFPFGVLIGVIAIGFFMPLVKLINDLS